MKRLVFSGLIVAAFLNCTTGHCSVGVLGQIRPIIPPTIKGDRGQGEGTNEYLYAPAEAAEKREYAIRWGSVRNCYLELTTQQNISHTVNRQRQNSDQTIGLGFDLDVTNVQADGNAAVKLTYSWIKLHQRSAMNEVTYDSAEPDASVPVIAQGFAALLDESCTAVMTPKGEVQSVQGLEQMRSSIDKKVPDGQAKEWVMASLQQFLSEQGMRELIEGILAIYPDRPVGVGGSWTDKLILSQSFGMVLESQHTLTSRRNGLATIEVNTTIKPNPKATPTKVGAMTVSAELSGQGTGTITIDENTGLINHSEVRMSTSGQLKVQQGGETPKENSIPTQLSQVSTARITQRGPTTEPTGMTNTMQAEPVVDANAVMERIKAFEGLPEALDLVDRRGRYEVREWLELRRDNRLELAAAVHKQVRAETRLIQEVAQEESAQKTTAALDTFLSEREQRLKRLTQEMREQARELRMGRSGLGRRGGTSSGRGQRYPQERTGRGRYPRGRNDYRTRQMPPGGYSRSSVNAQPVEQQADISIWLEAGPEDRIELADTVQMQFTEEMMPIQQIAVAEGAKKTTAAIDGVLLNRRERYRKLVGELEELLGVPHDTRTGYYDSGTRSDTSDYGERYPSRPGSTEDEYPREDYRRPGRR